MNTVVEYINSDQSVTEMWNAGNRLLSKEYTAVFTIHDIVRKSNIRMLIVVNLILMVDLCT